MRKVLLIIAASVFISVTTYSQSSGFGIGIVIGEPTGVSAKLWAASSNAFDFAAAWSFKGNGHLLVQTDYVWHSYDLIRVRQGKMPLYYGIGGRAVFSDDPLLGIRIPIGLNYQFQSAPIDLFAEIVPILDLTPSTDFDLGGGLGIRFWYK